MAKKPPALDLSPRKGSRELNRDVQYWLDEISACRTRESDYRKDGMRIREIYSGDRKESTPMNILFSNTETIAPATYSQVPRPVVRRRYKDDDPIGYAAARAGERMLSFLLDTNIEGYDTFNECLKAVNLDAHLPGRGVSSLKYDADVSEVDDGKDEAGKPKTMPVKKPYSELVCPEIRSWDRVYFGYARKWSKVPWVAYEEHIDKKEATRLFGAEKTRLIKFTKGETSDNEGKQGVDRRSEDERDTGARKTALIYQIWDKSGGRKIRYISPAYKDGYLLVAADELMLTGFFNCPRPVQFIEKTDDMTPTAPYTIYENQASELNSLTIRISGIVRAIKARGIYDTELGSDLANLMEGEDNELIPADKSSSLAAEKGLDKAIWFMPLDVLITTLRELVAAREQCKQVIYEITGISDIIRGASKASETLGAQQIKSQWGTLRIKPKQTEIQRYACDMLRIMLEIAAQKFSEDTWAKMTGLPYLTGQQIAQGKQMAEAAQMQIQQSQAILTKLAPPPNAQAMAAAGQQQQLAAAAVPAQTPQQQMAIQVNQQKMQAAQQTLEQLQQESQKAKWPEVLASLKDDIQRAYKIDIETNSTIEPEAAEDQKNIADMMAALGQFLQSVGPMVQQGIMPFQVAQSMLLAITRRFRFGDEIEEMIQQMKAPAPEDKSAEALKAAQEQLQQLQQQLAAKEMDARKTALDHSKESADKQLDLDKQKTSYDQLKSQSDLAEQKAQLANERTKLENDKKVFQLEQKHAVEKIAGNVEIANTKLKAQKDSAAASEKNASQAQKQSQDALKQVEARMKELDDVLGELDGDTPKSSKIAKARIGGRREIASQVESKVQAVDQKVASAMADFSEAVKHLQASMQQQGQALQRQMDEKTSAITSRIEKDKKETHALLTKAAGKRKKTVKRDAAGKIASVVEEAAE